MKKKYNNRQCSVDTVEQFKILQYINQYFAAGALEIEFIDRHTIKCTDVNGDSMNFIYNTETKKVCSK